MSDEQVRGTVLRVLGSIAPEADLAGLDPAGSLREQIDLDSIDFVNFVIGIAGELRVEVPETDYPRLLTLDDCVTYLTPRVLASSGPPGGRNGDSHASGRG